MSSQSFIGVLLITFSLVAKSILSQGNESDLLMNKFSSFEIMRMSLLSLKSPCRQIESNTSNYICSEALFFNEITLDRTSDGLEIECPNNFQILIHNDSVHNTIFIAVKNYDLHTQVTELTCQVQNKLLLRIENDLFKVHKSNLQLKLFKLLTQFPKSETVVVTGIAYGATLAYFIAERVKRILFDMQQGQIQVVIHSFQEPNIAFDNSTWSLFQFYAKGEIQSYRIQSSEAEDPASSELNCEHKQTIKTMHTLCVHSATSTIENCKKINYSLYKSEDLAPIQTYLQILD